ncbi:MAG: uracil-DNA glycosylase [Candidatus Thorarchaeota archaeon]|nr:uracil-DNA glycosylase [Candidatus Thorarchaeota archaeon]NIW14744.1 uracil-DNA glycosylase [Candidatus Thorarchaeota archaeon]NIW52570.1 uracil-DNA glycosylase [Candidatus Korarchaeota archaeon]
MGSIQVVYGKIVENIKTCKKCGLWKERTNAVPGEGSLDAEIMFIGEAPGREEDVHGRPFVGRAGELLDKFLGEIELQRKDVYITNILKCHPPGNRDPKQEEIEQCLPYLKEQMRVINPSLIVTLGRFATSSLLVQKTTQVLKISQVRGKLFELKEKIVIPTYHPAAALYNPSLQGTLEKDFRKIKSIVTGGATKKQNLLERFLKKPGKT